MLQILSNYRAQKLAERLPNANFKKHVFPSRVHTGDATIKQYMICVTHTADNQISRLSVLWQITFRCSNGHCIPNHWKCNLVNDCQNGSDETDCSPYIKTGNFRCRNQKCIPQSFACDTFNDCGDSSDETSCRALNGGRYEREEYRCPSDYCIPFAEVCNGRADCVADYSDEIECTVCKM